MFDSGITARELIDELKNEVDIAIEILDSSYVSWLDSLQQLLYSEIIKEQKCYKLTRSIMPGITLPGITSDITDIAPFEIEPEENESTPRFEDIHAFYVGSIQLIKSTLASGTIFPNTYFKYNDNIGYNISDEENPNAKIKIIYFVRPALVKDKGAENVNVMVPVEFIDLVKAKLRGEAYKLANEDALAAKWLNDYNILLETFKAWVADKSANFGL